MGFVRVKGFFLTPMKLGVVRMTCCLGGGESCWKFVYLLDQEHRVMEFVRWEGFFLTPMKLGVVRMTPSWGRGESCWDFVIP